MTEKKEFLNFNFKKRNACGQLNILSFEDHGHVIAYISSLKLSGYGDTPYEARKMVLDVVLKDFFETIIDLPKDVTLEEMERLGWERNELLSAKFQCNSFVDKKGILRNFNLPPETKISETLVEF